MGADGWLHFKRHGSVNSFKQLGSGNDLKPRSLAEPRRFFFAARLDRSGELQPGSYLDQAVGTRGHLFEGFFEQLRGRDDYFCRQNQELDFAWHNLEIAMRASFLERKARRPTEDSNAGEQGFSLVETLVASFILMFGLLGLASLLSYAVAANLENKSDAFATTLAVRKMEELKGQPSTALADGGCTLASNGDINFGVAAAGGYSQTVSGVANQSFDLCWNVATANGLRKIVVAARRTNGTKRMLMNVLRPVNIRCFKQP